MTFKEKIKTKQFWIAVLVFTILYVIVSEILDLWLDYGFDFAEFRSNRFSENNFFLLILPELIQGFLVGFIVLLIMYKEKKGGETISNTND